MSAGGPAGSTPAVGGTDAPAAPDRIIRKRSSGLLVGSIIVVVILLGAGVGAAYELHLFGGGSSTSHPPGTCPTGQTLAGLGASFVEPLLSQWTSSFHSSSGNLVSYSDTGGSGAGVTALQAPTVDFAATDDPLNTTQIGGFHGYSVLTIPIAAGGLAIVYNLPTLTTPPLQLNGSVLAEIYTGTITSWSDPAIAALNPGVTLPNDPILTVHREDAAGTTYVLTDLLSKDSAAWKAGPGKGITVAWPTAPTQRAISGNSALASFVQKTAYAIGYVDLTDVLNTPDLDYAKIQNPSGKFILPTLASAGSAIRTVTANTTFPALNDTAAWSDVSMVNSPAPADYPLATLVYFFVYQQLDHGYQASVAKSQVIGQWLNWTITAGQAYASPLYYVPLPSAIASLDQTGLKTLTFDGKTLPACR